MGMPAQIIPLLGNFVDGKAGSNPLKRFSAGGVQLQGSHDSRRAHNFRIDFLKHLHNLLSTLVRLGGNELQRQGAGTRWAQVGLS